MARTYSSSQKADKATDHATTYALQLIVPGWTTAPFTSGIITVNTSSYDFSLNLDGTSRTYYGAEYLLSIGNFQETSELKRNGIEVVFSGIKNEMLNVFLSDDYDVNRVRVKIYDVTFELGASGMEFANPTSTLIHNGLVDAVNYKTSRESTTISLKTVSAFSDWSRPRHFALGDASQKEKDSSDTALQYITKTVIKQVTWGNGD